METQKLFHLVAYIVKIYYYDCVGGGTHVEVRGQICGVSFLLPP